jgi:regulator of cell morphogenesis and NO signaling
MSLADTTLARIVLDHPECAGVFQKRRIDFCFRGDLTVSQVCDLHTMDSRDLVGDLERAIATGGPGAMEDPREMPTLALVEHIVARHHGLLRDALPFLGPLVAKVARVHGDHDARLADVQQVFANLLETLETHLASEEEVFFRLARSVAPERGEVARELDGARREHLEIAAALRRIRELTDDFEPPPRACASYRTLLVGLRALEHDVLRYVHVESHVLFPRLTAA